MFSVRTIFVMTLIVIVVCSCYCLTFFKSLESAQQFLNSTHGHRFVIGMLCVLFFLLLGQIVVVTKLSVRVAPWSVIADHLGRVEYVFKKKRRVWMSSVYKSKRIIIFTYRLEQTNEVRSASLTYVSGDREFTVCERDFTEDSQALRHAVNEIIEKERYS